MAGLYSRHPLQFKTRTKPSAKLVSRTETLEDAARDTPNRRVVISGNMPMNITAVGKSLKIIRK